MTWDQDYRNAHTGNGPRNYGSAGDLAGDYARKREEWAKTPEQDDDAFSSSGPSTSRSARERRPSARQLRRQVNPPPDYAGLRRASNVLAVVLFVPTAAFAFYEGWVGADPTDELIVVPLLVGIFFAAVGKASLMFVRWVMRLLH